MSGGPVLTPTEALLAQAAATTPDEALAAQLALIRTGMAMLAPLDQPLVGDGLAGRHLLGGWRVDPRAQARQTVASRSGAIQFAREQAAAAAAGHVERRTLDDTEPQRGAAPSGAHEGVSAPCAVEDEEAGCGRVPAAPTAPRWSLPEAVASW